MKIRTDFVTNSSSSSFVTYKLVDSEFCKYLHEQMEKHGITVDDCDARPASEILIAEDSLDASISSAKERLYRDDYESYDTGYTTSKHNADIERMAKRFLDVIREFIALEKVDNLELLYDAFVRDLGNGKFECDVYLGNTD